MYIICIYRIYKHKEDMKPINITIDKESLRKLDSQCKREGRNRSQQIRELIKQEEARKDDGR